MPVSSGLGHYFTTMGFTPSEAYKKLDVELDQSYELCKTLGDNEMFRDNKGFNQFLHKKHDEIYMRLCFERGKCTELEYDISALDIKAVIAKCEAMIERAERKGDWLYCKAFEQEKQFCLGLLERFRIRENN